MQQREPGNVNYSQRKRQSADASLERLRCRHRQGGKAAIVTVLHDINTGNPKWTER